MNEPIICECGNGKFLWFGDFLRCPKCRTEFKQSGPKGKREFWMRRFNKMSYQYDKNWEHITTNRRV